MPLTDTSQTTRTEKLRGQVLANFHFLYPFKQIQGPRGTTPSSVLTESRSYVGILYASVVPESSIFPIVSGNKYASGETSGLTQISFAGITDFGTSVEGALDDAFVPIPMGGMAFSFFGTNYSNRILWNSNNAITFGNNPPFSANIVSISATTAPSILLGNYDRLCRGLYYTNSTIEDYSITTLIVQFCNYYTDVPSASPTYTYQIRFLKETTGSQRQFVEVCVVTSPPSTGYNSSGTVYPSGVNESGHPIDTNALTIDPTKTSSYNITNGTVFLNPCGTTFTNESPSAGTSFVFSSDSTGTNWSFQNHAYVQI